MNIHTILIFVASLACYLTAVKGNEGLKYPPGATDLVPDQRFNEFKLRNIETVSFTVKAVDIQWDQVEIKGLNEYQFDYPTEIIELKLENEKLKKEVSELKQRLSRLEALLNPKSEPGTVVNTSSAVGNSKNQQDD